MINSTELSDRSAVRPPGLGLHRVPHILPCGRSVSSSRAITAPAIRLFSKTLPPLSNLSSMTFFGPNPALLEIELLRMTLLYAQLDGRCP
jgi:hypothetical protein